MEFWSVCLILFLIIDPLGKISSFLGVLKHVDPERERRVIIREMGIALLIMLLFNFIGEWIFSFLSLSETAVQISAGLILFLTALRILFPNIRDKELHVPGEEPMLVPLAVPYIASPGLLAIIMVYAHMIPDSLTMPLAIGVAWFFAMVILAFARPLQALLGYNGLLGIERLMGMVLVMLAVQRFIFGVKLFVDTAQLL